MAFSVNQSCVLSSSRGNLPQTFRVNHVRKAANGPQARALLKKSTPVASTVRNENM